MRLERSVGSQRSDQSLDGDVGPPGNLQAVPIMATDSPGRVPILDSDTVIMFQTASLAIQMIRNIVGDMWATILNPVAILPFLKISLNPGLIRSISR